MYTLSHSAHTLQTLPREYPAHVSHDWTANQSHSLLSAILAFVCHSTSCNVINDNGDGHLLK